MRDGEGSGYDAACPGQVVEQTAGSAIRRVDGAEETYKMSISDMRLVDAAATYPKLQAKAFGRWLF